MYMVVYILQRHLLLHLSPLNLARSYRFVAPVLVLASSFVLPLAVLVLLTTYYYLPLCAVPCHTAVSFCDFFALFCSALFWLCFILSDSILYKCLDDIQLTIYDL